MAKFFNKFKIPTLFGLAMIVIGLSVGLYLILSQQTEISKIQTLIAPKNILLSNITEDSVTVSWQTDSPIQTLLSFGLNNPEEQQVADDRDNLKENETKKYLNHYVTLKKLLPKTTYQFKIISGRIISETQKIQTAGPLSENLNLSPVVGSVLNGEIPLDDGIAYLQIPGAVIQSFLIKNGGNFIIPVSKVLKSDLSETVDLEENTEAKLTVRMQTGDTEVLFKLKANSKPLPPIKIGQNLDLTEVVELPDPTPDTTEENDINGDGKINAADYAIILDNFGKKPKNEEAEEMFKKSDLNKDGIVDKKDSDLLNQKLKDLSSF